MLYSKLKNYSESGIYPFHMPGHKRTDIKGDSTIPYAIDLTEIYDFDNLHNAEGYIKEVEEKAEMLYSVKHAHILVNGATGGILSSVRAMTSFGDRIIMARNCHKSVYNAVELCSLKPLYVLPEYDSEFGINASVKPSEIEKLLKKYDDIRLVIVTSPTYEGIVSDIKNIAEICHRHGAYLLVDEAHGAHFPFSDSFPSEAVALGADAAIVSLHKTLPSLTQTALLLTNNDKLHLKFAENLSVFETSSPSYILMSSVVVCLDFIEKNKSAFEEYALKLKSFYNECKKLKCVNILTKKYDYFDFDISKLIISVRNTTMSGTELANILRENYKIETEMSYTDYVIAMTSVCDTYEGFERLINALCDIDKSLSKSEISNSGNTEYIIPERSFCSSDRYRIKGRIIDINESSDMVSLEYLWAYPPGIPLLVPGEIISKEIITQIKKLTDSKVELYSTNKNAPNKIYVADFD